MVKDLTAVLKLDLLHFGGKDLHSRVTHGWRKSHSGNLPARGTVLLWLTIVVGTLGLHQRHGKDGRHPCKDEMMAMSLIRRKRYFSVRLLQYFTCC